MKMKFKKETKHTVVYEDDSDGIAVPVESVYVSKMYLVSTGCRAGVWPKEIELAVTPVREGSGNG